MGMTMIFWIVVGVIGFSAVFFRYRASISRDRVLQTLAEKGQPIPPELLRNAHSGWSLCANPLRLGIVLICIGVAVFIAARGAPYFYGQNLGRPIGGAVFPFMIGIGFVVISLIDRRPPVPPEK
jgi:Na+/melibiose symporter-like transporter